MGMLKLDDTFSFLYAFSFNRGESMTNVELFIRVLLFFGAWYCFFSLFFLFFVIFFWKLFYLFKCISLWMHQNTTILCTNWFRCSIVSSSSILTNLTLITFTCFQKL